VVEAAVQLVQELVVAACGYIFGVRGFFGLNVTMPLLVAQLFPGVLVDAVRPLGVEKPQARGLHSSTIRLYVTTFCGIRWVVSVKQTALVGVRRGRVSAPAPRADPRATPAR
jgi:hypothetical protein